MTLPNFLIIGASKSGTTSLFNYLNKHPDIYFPPIKEPSYFSDGQPTFVHSDDEYAALFEGRTTEKAVGEATTSYLYDRQAPGRIKTLLGDVNILIILRNPADRAYSAWGHNYYLIGYEKLPFEAALREEGHRISSTEFRKTCPFYYGGYHYFDVGLYYEQVQRYYDTFGRQKLKVIIFEEFVKDTAKTCTEIFKFLNVDPLFRPVLNKHNVAPAFRSAIIQKFLLRPPLFLQNIYETLPMKLKLALYQIGKFFYGLNIQQKDRVFQDRKLRSDLLDRYYQDIKKLENLLNRDLSLWYDPVK